jgi:serine/threonine protein kinase
MGIVYEGFDTMIRRRGAIKTLRTEMFEPRQFSQVLERSKREARSAGRLTHPHIVTIHNYGEQEGTPYIKTKPTGIRCHPVRFDTHPRV